MLKNFDNENISSLADNQGQLSDRQPNVSEREKYKIHTERHEPTCTKDGNIEYWYCGVCDRYFSDSNFSIFFYIFFLYFNFFN